MVDLQKLKIFKIYLYPLNNTNVEATAEYTGSSNEWQSYRQIKLPGFDGSQTINLDDLWLNVFSNYPSNIQIDVTGIETIIKYSGTQQLTEKFTIIAELCYE